MSYASHRVPKRTATGLHMRMENPRHSDYDGVVDVKT